MKNIFKPILFSTPMVQAIQTGTKTQTRRTKGLDSINEKPNNYRYDGISDDEHDSYIGCHFFEYLDKEGNPKETYTPEECPYAIGDVLWVRETFHSIHDSDTDIFLRYGYKADNDYKGAKWKPSIFMPREACRIFLKVTNIRAERLMEMSKEDAVCEGVKIASSSDKKVFFDGRICYELKGNTVTDNPIQAFQNIWENINGKDSWSKNPWVWVIEFEKVERPNDFIV